MRINYKQASQQALNGIIRGSKYTASQKKAAQNELYSRSFNKAIQRELQKKRSKVDTSLIAKDVKELKKQKEQFKNVKKQLQQMYDNVLKEYGSLPFQNNNLHNNSDVEDRFLFLVTYRSGDNEWQELINSDRDELLEDVQDFTSTRVYRKKNVKKVKSYNMNNARSDIIELFNGPNELYNLLIGG